MQKDVVIPTHLENLNKLLTVGDEQGLRPGRPYLFYGTAQQGKSVLLDELATHLAIQYSVLSKEQKNIVVVDTEGVARDMIDAWIPTWKKKFGKNYFPEFEVIEATSTETLLKALGLNVIKEIKIGKKGGSGKTELSILGTSTNKVLDACKKVNAGVVILDSIIAPLMVLIAGGLKNLPVRASAINLVLEALNGIKDQVNPFILVTGHASKDPTNPSPKLDFTGGKNIHHGFKYVFLVQQSKHHSTTSAREIILHRYLNVKEDTRRTFIWLDDEGFKDVSDEEMTRLRTPPKKKGNGKDEEEQEEKSS